jgi:hypothetical protein
MRASSWLAGLLSGVAWTGAAVLVRICRNRFCDRPAASEQRCPSILTWAMEAPPKLDNFEISALGRLKSIVQVSSFCFSSPTGSTRLLEPFACQASFTLVSQSKQNCEPHKVN